MGMGHLYRCHKIIEAIGSELFSVTLLTRAYEEAEQIFKMISCDRVIVVSSDPSKEEESAALSRLGITFAICINDQLNSEVADIQMLRNFCRKLITFDDRGPGASLADCIVNVLYPNNPPLLGEINDFSFHIIKDYSEEKRSYNFRPDVQTILVNQGAADTWGAIPDIISDLAHSKREYQLMVLLGPAFRHFRELDMALKSQSRHRVEVIAKTNDMAQLYLRADLAILGAGNTLIEALSLGVPCLVSTREEKELITTKLLLERDLVAGDLNLYRGVGIASQLDDLDMNKELRKKRYEASREAFGYLGLLKIVEKVNELLY